MMRRFHPTRLPALAIAASWLATATAAGAQAVPAPSGESAAPGAGAQTRRQVTYFDLSAGAGYSTNPFLRLQDRSSAFGRVGLNGFHSWNSERGSTWLSGYVEDTAYLKGSYGNKAIFSINAHTDRSISEKLRVYGDLAAYGDVAGQLTNRFAPVPPVVTPPDVPPPSTNPELFNLSGRQYRVSGQVGAAIATSTRSSISLDASVVHGFFTGVNKIADYTTYQGSIGYSHQLSERTWGGVNVSVEHQDFRGGDYANVINTTLTMRTQLAADIQASGAVGLLAIYQHRLGQDEHSYSPSFRASICKSGEKSSFCFNASRDAEASLGIGLVQGGRGASISTNFELSYRRKVGEFSQLYATATATRNTTVNNGLPGENFSSTYLSGLIGYDHKIGKRLFLGVTGGARKLYQNGPDPKTDVNGNVYLRYRLGDLL